jgi:hypothetical protein
MIHFQLVRINGERGLSQYEEAPVVCRVIKIELNTFVILKVKTFTQQYKAREPFPSRSTASLSDQETSGPKHNKMALWPFTIW